MTKQETLNKVLEVAEANGASKKLVKALTELLEPKRGGQINPPIFEDGVEYLWCRLHNRYEAAEVMVKVNGANKGICKAAQKSWSYNHNLILNARKLVSKLVTGGNIDEAIKEGEKLSKMEAQLNESVNYDYEADWKNYNRTLEVY